MIDAPQTTTYTKQPTATPQTAAAPIHPVIQPAVGGVPPAANTPTPPKKKGRMNWKMAAGLIVMVLVVGALGVGLYLQGQSQDVRQQAAVSSDVPANNCTLSFTIAPVVTPPPTPTPGVTPSPSPSVTPSPTATPSATPSPTPSVSPSPSPTYACAGPCTTDAQCQTVNADYICSAANGNTCRLASNPSSISCSPSQGSFACNSTCNTNADCASANANYVCATIGTERFCRLSSNINAANCAPPLPTPTPTIGCNQACVTNADCTNPDHICSVDNGSVCRLATNPNNASCAPETIATVPGTPGQPELPPELPVSGPADWGNWLKIGLGGLVVGALLLLFL